MMLKIFSIAKNSFREAIRSNILWAVLLFALFIIMASVAFGSVSVGEQFRVVKSFGYFMTSLSGVIISVITGVTLFQKEISQKTIYNILSKSVSRSQFLYGKFLGLWATSSFLVFLMLVILQTIVFPIEGSLDILFFEAFFCMTLEIAIISAITVFFSSMAVTPVLPGLFSFAFFVSGRSISYLAGYLSQESNPNGALLTLANILNYVIPDLRALSRYDNLVYNIGINGRDASLMTLYTLCYCTLILLLSGIIFKRREF